MHYLPLSFLAGLLTILAPCVLPMLPIIIGGSVVDGSRWRPLIITASLGVSIVLFTLLLKVSTLFIEVPADFWKWFSSGLIFILALSMLLPGWWGNISRKMKLEGVSHGALNSSSKRKGVLGMVMTGVALGPVFASCSPVYFLILGTVLPLSLFAGLVNLIAYGFGLSLILFVIAYFGQRAVKRLRWGADPRGVFRKVMGVLFLFIGLSIFLGWDKLAEAWILDQGWFDVTVIEERLLERD